MLKVIEKNNYVLKMYSQRLVNLLWIMLLKGNEYIIKLFQEYYRKSLKVIEINNYVLKSILKDWRNIVYNGIK